MSQHIGDLGDYSTLRTFETGVEHMQNLLGIRPEVIAYDLHPDYAATRWALEHDEVVRLEGVQHHHAHIASVMAEQGEAGPVIGVAFDGSGYGPDGAIWGGEFLVATLTAFMRVGHLEYVPLPGGEQAIRGPWRMAAAWLDHLYGESMLSLPLDFVRRLANRPWPQIRQMIRVGLNCPLTSSMGRLFDAVSALLGVRELVNYEGQAAVELEMLADPDCHESYALYSPNDESLVVPGSAFIRPVVNDLMQGVAHEVIAARFHNTVAASIARTCEQIRSRGWPATVALGGGVFQNALLLQRTRAELSRSGFRVLTAVQVPPNDGGLSLGQAAVAGARMAAEVASKGGA